MTRRIVLSTLIALFAAPAWAQETRAELLERQRAEKAAKVAPYQPAGLEKALLWVEEHDPMRMIAPYNGFYVQYGYTYKPIGSGIAFGGGWRHDLFDRNARLVLEAGQSFRNYRMVRGDFFLPWLLDERLELGVEGIYSLHPQEDFYGLGSSAQRGNRVNFRYRAPELQVRAVARPVPWLRAGVRLGRVNVDVGSGTDPRFPSIEQRFGEAEAPGLSQQPDFTYTDLFTALDTRDQPGNARGGSYLGLLWRRYNDRDLDRYTFDRLEFDAQQFLPIFDKKRIVAVRLQVYGTSADDGQQVPFYFLPTIGGSDTLRSYADFRFRDHNVLALNVEYRWEAFSGLDMALFSDFGSVAPRFSDLEFADVRGAYGIGLRFNTYKAVFLRFDVAGGGAEGLRTFIKFSKAF